MGNISHGDTGCCMKVSKSCYDFAALIGPPQTGASSCSTCGSRFPHLLPTSSHLRHILHVYQVMLDIRYIVLRLRDRGHQYYFSVICRHDRMHFPSFFGQESCISWKIVRGHTFCLAMLSFIATPMAGVMQVQVPQAPCIVMSPLLRISLIRPSCSGLWS